MSDVGIAVLSSGLAIAVAIISYVLERVMLEPAIELRRAVGKVHFVLTRYAREIANPGAGEHAVPLFASVDQISAELRESGSSLLVATSGVVWYPVTAWIARLPIRAECVAAFHELIELSNSDRSDGRRDDRIRQSILRRLRLPERWAFTVVLSGQSIAWARFLAALGMTPCRASVYPFPIR